MSRALFIGRTVLDVIALVEEFPEPDRKSKALANDIIPGGSSLNAAVAFAHLGGDAALATSMGATGPVRDFVDADLKKHRVAVHDVSDDPDFQIPQNTVISTRSQGTRMIVNSAQDDCSRVKNCTGLFKDGFDVIQLDQYEFPFIEQHYDDIRSFDGPVVMDGGGWKDWSVDFLRLADIPIVSEFFYSKGHQAFAELCTDLGHSRWAITRGNKGVIWHDGDQSGEIPAVSIKAVDTMGAGDFFHGAFCHAFAETGKFVESLSSAAQVAAKSCESAGTRSWMNV